MESYDPFAYIMQLQHPHLWVQKILIFDTFSLLKKNVLYVYYIIILVKYNIKLLNSTFVNIF